MTQDQKQPLSKHIKSASIILMMGLMLAVGYVALTSYGARLSGQLLKQMVAEQTSNRYQLNFDDISISLLDKKITAENFQLTPDGQGAIDSTQAIYQVFIPEASLYIGSLVKLYQNKELTLRGLTITDPNVSMYKYERGEKKSTLSLEAGDLFQLINDYLFRFSVESLTLTNGSINYSNKAEVKPIEFFLQNIDFKIKDLVIDSSQMAQNRFLFAEELTLVITDQQFLLGDSIHRVHFDRFSISTKSRNVLFQNLSLKPRTSKVRASDTEKLNLYNIEIPALNFRGVDFYKAYMENTLSIDSMRISKPSIQINQKDLNSKLGVRNSLPALFSRLYDRLQIRKIYFDKAVFNLTTETDSTRQLEIKGHETSFQLYELDIDLKNFFIGDKKTYFQNMALDVSGLDIFLPELAHELSFDRIRFSSLDSITSIRNAKIRSTGADTSLQINGSIDLAGMRGVDFRKLWLKNELRLRYVELKTPRIDGFIPSSTSKKAGFIKLLVVDSLSLQEGRLAFRMDTTGFQVNDLFVNLSQLHVDPKKSIRLDSLVNEFTIAGGSSSYFTPSQKLSTQNISFTDQGRTIFIDEFALVQHDTLTPATIGNIKLTGLQLNKLLVDNMLDFDSLKLTRPLIRMVKKASTDTLRNRLPGSFGYPNFNSITVVDGAFSLFDSATLISHSSNLYSTITYLRVDSITHMLSGEGTIYMDSAWVNLKSMDHQMVLNTISTSTLDSTLRINKIRFFPNTETTQSTFDIQADSSIFSQVDLHRLINGDGFFFGSGSIQSPGINILIKDTVSGQPISKPKIKFDSLELNGDQLGFTSMRTGTRASTQEFRLLIHSFDLENDSVFLFAENYDLRSDRISLSLPDQKTITSSRGAFHSKSGDLDLEQIEFEEENIKLSVPYLSINGLDTRLLQSDQALHMQSITLQQPDFRLRIKSDTSTLPKKARHFPDLKIDELTIRYSEVAIQSNDFNHGDSVFFHDLSMQIQNIATTKEDPIGFRKEYFESVSFSGRDLSYTFPDSIYTASIGTYQFNPIGNTLELSNIALDPNYSRNEYQETLTYQSDWFDGKVAKLAARNFQLDSLLIHKKLLIERLDIDRLTLDTHRDKRLPRKPDVYKPLPAERLKQLTFPMHVDSIYFNDAFITHSEFSEEGQLPGVIFFKDIDGRLLNATNVPKMIAQNKSMQFEANGVLMETGDFQLTTTFDLNSIEDRFTMQGTVGSMELSELNKFLEHTSYVYVRDGTSQQVTFDFEANNTYSLGKMRFYYDNLKISVLNQETYLQKGHGSSIKSFFANTFIVNTRNPNFIFLRKGDIFHERDQSKSIFNYWAKALLSGIVSSIGAKNNKKDIKQLNKEIKEQLDREANNSSR